MKLQFFLLTIFSSLIVAKAHGMGLSESGSSSGEVKTITAALRNPLIVRTKSSDVDPTNTTKLDTEMISVLAQKVKKSSPRGNSPRDGRPRTSSLSHCSGQSDQLATSVELP